MNFTPYSFAVYNIWHTLLIIFLTAFLGAIAVFVPVSLLSFMQFLAFTALILLVVSVVDSVAYIPFAQTKVEFASALTLVLTLILIRQVQVESLYLPNIILLSLLSAWWGSIILHTILSESKLRSYFGDGERGMGLLYRITIPVILISAWQIYTMDLFAFFLVLIFAGIVETVILILQWLDEEKYISFHFSYQESIGHRRQTGTLSNPMQVSNFLVSLLPLTLFFYNRDFVLFVVFYLILAFGLGLSFGRGSFLAAVGILPFEIVYIAITPAPLYMPIIAILVFFLSLIIYAFTLQGRNTFKRFQGLFKLIQTQDTNIIKTSALNRAYLYQAAKPAFEERPFLGWGISNVARALRNKITEAGNEYFKDFVVDYTHNYYLDLLVEGGITHLIIYMFLLITAMYFSIVNGAFYVFIALLAYSIDIFFSFPLQANYLLSMLLISVPAVTVTVFNPALAYFFIPLIVLYAISLYFSDKNNVSMRYTTLALRSTTLSEQMKNIMFAIQNMPFEDRYYRIASSIMQNALSSKGQIINTADLADFTLWFESTRTWIEKNSESPDIPYSTFALFNALMYEQSKDPRLYIVAIAYTNKALEFNKFNSTALLVQENISIKQ